MWSLGHFIQWSFLGRFVFSNWYIFFILSVGWELIELKLPYEFAVETLENGTLDKMTFFRLFVVAICAKVD